MTPEKIVQSKIMNYLEQLKSANKPVIYDRRQAGGYSYKMGIPDLWAVIDGVHLEIEVKAPGEKLRPMQEKYRDNCKFRHVKWCCFDNIEGFKDYLQKEFDVYL